MHDNLATGSNISSMTAWGHEETVQFPYRYMYWFKVTL